MSEKYHRDRKKTLAYIYSINEIKPMRLFYNYIDKHYSKHITLHKQYSDIVTRHQNEYIFNSKNPRIMEVIKQYLGVKFTSDVRLANNSDEWNDILYKFCDQARVNFSLPIILDDKVVNESSLDKVLYWLGYIMNALIGKFYRIFNMAIIDHCGFDKGTTIHFSKILPDSNSKLTDLSYEPFYSIPLSRNIMKGNIVRSRSLFDIIIYPTVRKLCLYEYVTLDNAQSFVDNHNTIQDIITKDSTYSDRYHAINYRVYEYTDLVDMIRKIDKIMSESWCQSSTDHCYEFSLIKTNDKHSNWSEDHDSSDNYKSYYRNSDTQVNVKIGNLTNYLYCDVRDNKKMQVFNMYFGSSGEKAALLTKPTQIDVVSKAIYNKDYIKDCTDSSDKKAAPHVSMKSNYINMLNIRRQETLQQFVNDNVEDTVRSIVMNAIRSTDSYIPTNLPISINVFIRNFTIKTAKIGIYYTVNGNDCYDDKHCMCSFNLYNYDDNSKDSRQNRPFIVKKMIQSFLPGSRPDLTLGISRFINSLTDIDNKRFIEFLDTKNIVINKNSALAIRTAWRNAFTKLYDTIIKDNYYKDQLSKLCDLYHKYDQQFNNDIEVIDMKKHLKDHSNKIHHIVKETLTDKIEDSINNLTMKAVDKDIDKFVSQINYYCGTNLILIHIE